MSQNQKLKNDINMLRREKKNFIETQNSIQEQIRKYEHDTEEKMKEVERKKVKAEQLRR